MWISYYIETDLNGIHREILYNQGHIEDVTHLDYQQKSLNGNIVHVWMEIFLFELHQVDLV